MIVFTMAIAETPDKQVICYLAVPQRPSEGQSLVKIVLKGI